MAGGVGTGTVGFRSFDRDASPHGSFAVHHFAAQSRAHAGAEPELAGSLDLADAAWVVHGHWGAPERGGQKGFKADRASVECGIVHLLCGAVQ